MTLHNIDPFDLLVRPPHLLRKQTMVLCAGNFQEGNYNAMIIGWGLIGNLWNKPVFVAPVRPTRYTYGFMEKYPDFTVTAFPDGFQDDLTYLGTHSGRDGDKLSQTKLTPITALEVQTPTFEQAELSIECRKISWMDMDPNQFLDLVIENQYPNKDYHRLYIGEIVSIMGASKFDSSLR